MTDSKNGQISINDDIVHDFLSCFRIEWQTSGSGVGNLSTSCIDLSPRQDVCSAFLSHGSDIS